MNEKLLFQIDIAIEQSKQLENEIKKSFLINLIELRNIVINKNPLSTQEEKFYFEMASSNTQISELNQSLETILHLLCLYLPKYSIDNTIQK